MISYSQSKRFSISFGKDSLIDWSLQYYSIPLLYAVTFYLLYSGISPMYLVTFIFACLPLCDEYFEFDVRNPTKEEEKRLENDMRFKFPLYVCVFLDWFITFFGVKLLMTREYNVLNQAVILFGLGVFAGSNINVAHELTHKTDNLLDYVIGWLTMSKCLYMHWVSEHLYGHHRWVATPNDPATSKKNQTLYNFYIQTCVGTWVSAWNIECERLKKKGQSPYSLSNRMYWFTLNNICVPGLFYKAYGFWGAYYFVVVGIISILFLETVNYIEHYGLSRKEISPGVYEKVDFTHSWNAPHRLTNYLLFKLQRHSDHHANSQKPYQILLSDERSPTLPNGYALCVIIALFPSVHFDIMNKQLDMYKTGKFDPKVADYIQAKVRSFLLKLGSFLVLLTYISVSTGKQ